MVFSSYTFIFLFLPAVLLGYYLLAKIKNPIYQKMFLIGASLFFYGFSNVNHLKIIVASIIVNYIVALGIQKFRNKKISVVLLTIGIIFNVFILGYFKYRDFFVENINFIFRSDFAIKNILLPLGISFYTFQQLSFLVSVFKQEEVVERFEDYCVFVMFFPQLVAGPIVLYSEMIPQFKDAKRRNFCAENMALGIYLFCIGLFKKLVVADTLALFVDNGFGINNIGVAAAWITSLSYTLQIYFDFSGYSDMAIGLGKMFNIDIPFNFLSPYKSESITVFWRRWHITLGRALSTYIYKPLGGNRKGVFRTCINLFLTFAISGLWHGAAWTFVLWGTLHGVIMIFERIFKSTLEKIPKILRISLTFLAVNFLWVLFRAEEFSQAQNIYNGMFNITNINLAQLADVAFDSIINFPTIVDVVYLIAVVTGLLVIVFNGRNSENMMKKFAFSANSVVFTAVLFSISILHLVKESVFIYFNF